MLSVPENLQLNQVRLVGLAGPMVLVAQQLLRHRLLFELFRQGI
jgi:hypothetical protein